MSGQRTAITELSGRTAGYGYDALYRLTAEQISSDPGSSNGLVSYAYDKVGNRQTRTSTLPGIDNQNLGYSDNDLLLNHTYDANGNTLQADGNSDTYDFKDRLIRRIRSDFTTLDYDYNAAGILVAKTASGARIDYHIDGLNPTGYAQVLEEIQSGLVTVAYLYGHDLIAQDRLDLATSSWTQTFYLYEGIGTVRGLTDATGVLTDTYTYGHFEKPSRLALPRSS